MAWRGFPFLCLFLCASGCTGLLTSSHLVQVLPNECEKPLDLDSAKDTALKLPSIGEKVQAAKEPVQNVAGKTLKPQDLPPALQLINAREEKSTTEEIDPCVAPFVLPPPLNNSENQNTAKEAGKGNASKEKNGVNCLETPPSIPLPREVQALHEFCLGKKEEGITKLKEIASPAKEDLAILIPLTARLCQMEPLSKNEAFRWLGELKKVQDSLRGKTDLQLANLQYCKQVHGYGSYEPVGKNHEFQQGQGSSAGEKVLLYVEVANVLPRKMPSGYEAILTSSIEIHDANGKLITMNFPAKIDVSQTPRNDFHLTFQFRVPPKLPAGFYTLSLTVEESPAPDSSVRQPRLCKKSHDFRVSLPSFTKN